MEQWNNGMVGKKMVFPIFHHSNFLVFFSVPSVAKGFEISAFIRLLNFIGEDRKRAWK